MPKTTLIRQENVGLGNFSGHFDIFDRMLLFFSEEIFQKIMIDFEAAIDLKASKMDQKAVNFLPCDLIKKACKVVGLKKLCSKESHLDRCCPQRWFIIKQNRLLRSLQRSKSTHLQVRRQFLVKWRPTG